MVPSTNGSPASAGHAQLLELFEALDTPVYLSDPSNHEILYVNPALKAVAGDVTGRTCYEALRRRNKPCPQCAEGHAAGSAPRTRVWDFRDEASGRWYHCIDRMVPWHDGRTVRCEIAFDITERMNAEQGLRQRTEDLALINCLNEAANRGESMAAIIDLLGQQTRTLFACNGVTVYLLSEDRRSLRLQNLTLASPMVRQVERLIGMAIPEVRIALRDGGVYERLLRDGKPVLTTDPAVIHAMIAEQTDNPVLRALIPAIAGLIGVHSVISIPLVTHGEAVGLMDVSRRDAFSEEDLQRFVAISGQLSAMLHRHRADQALRQSEEKFRALSEQSPNMMWINCRGRIVYANQVCVDTMGYTREELCAPDFDFMSLVAPEHRDVIRRTFVSHSRDEDVPLYEYALITRDGRRIEALTTTRLIDYGGERAILGTVVDISERKAAEREHELARQQLAQAERLKSVGATAAGLAHDFNNLLMGIRGFAEMIDMGLGAGHPLHADIEQIYAVTDRANELTRQMLLFGRKQPAQLVPASLDAIVEGLRPVIERTAGERVRVDLRLAPNLRPVRANRSQIEQAILNLVVNAHDAMPEGGTLTIATENVELDDAGAQRIPGGRPGRFVVLRVDDTGCGMDDAVRQHLFEPFFTTKPRKRGSGLGLATVYGTVQQHEGMIAVESSPGKGASFRVFLPAN